LREISRPEVVLNVAMLVFVGTPALQLPGVLHRLDDVLVQLSVVCAHDKFVRITAIPSTANVEGPGSFIVLLLNQLSDRKYPKPMEATT
jgi:hypothetical protein